jgi:xanthine dehydrogenase small subunit
MEKSMKFLANDTIIDTSSRRAAPALDFIREELGLTGTKEGCREGDCGACAVLVGTRVPSSEVGAVLVGTRAPSSEGGAARGGAVAYRATPSCLLALGELEGRHLVTIEGLAAGARARGLADGLTPVMRALVEENGSQCGFCSPGIVISLTGWLLSGVIDVEGALTAVEGNLCRCTGYGAIRRAAARLAREFADLPPEPAARLAALEKAGVVPGSLGRFASREILPEADLPEAEPRSPRAARTTLGGGTDFFVRNPDPEPGFEAELLDLRPEYAGIRIDNGLGTKVLEIGAAVSVRDFFASPLVRSFAPGIESFEAEMASSLIRGRATLGGNVANASPVADMTAMLIALGATAVLEGPAGRRELPLPRFFLGYKKLDLREGEIMACFRIPSRPKAPRFNFEKVAKRRRLDIASVNTAALFEIAGGDGGPKVERAILSAGGVAPTPLLLEKTGALLAGRKVDAALAREAAAAAAAEVAPISDVRGTADYRRRLLERLVIGHFIRLFPETGLAEELFP